MASASTITTMNLLLGHIISEKLSKNNYLLWKAQVLPIVCGARLEGFLTGATTALVNKIDTMVNGKDVKIPNPVYEAWEATGQQVLGFLLSSLTKEVLQQVATCTTAAAARKTIQDSFDS